MALDVAGHHTEAERAYEWLVDIQLPNGGWYAYYANDGSIEDHKIDTNVCAYIATGVYHHYRSTWDRGFAENLWPAVEARARVRAVAAPPRRRSAVGGRARRRTRGTTRCSPARRASSTRCAAAPPSAKRSARRARRGSTPPTGWSRSIRTRPARVRAEDPLGDGLVLPGPHRRARRARRPRRASPKVGTCSPWRVSASAASATSRG